MRYRDFGKIIQDHAHKNGFSVVRTYCGHGINQLFHCAPNVPHYASKFTFVIYIIDNKILSYLYLILLDNKAIGILKPGHIFTIEPMINEGVHHDILW